MSKVIRNYLFVFVVSLILVLSFGSCMPEQEVEKPSEELATEINGSVGTPGINPISANERGYFSTSMGKAVNSGGQYVTAFGADFGYLHAINWKYPMVVKEATTNFDLYPLELNHEVIVVGFRSTMKMYSGRIYDICFKWYNPDNEKVFEATERTEDAGDYGYDHWDAYDFISWIGFCGWEILENGTYRVEITLKKVGSSSNIFSQTKNFTVSGGFDGPDEIYTPHLNIGARYRSDGWHYYTNYPDGIYNSDDDKKECSDGTFYYRSHGTLYHYTNGSGALVLDGGFTAYDTISALGGAAASHIVARLAAERILAKELWYYGYKAYNVYGKIKLWGPISVYICYEIEQLIENKDSGDVGGTVYTEYNNTENRQEFTLCDVNSSTGEILNETKFAYDFDNATNGTFPYYDLPENDIIEIDVPSNAHGNTMINATVQNYINCSKVKFYIDGSLKKTDTTNAYNYSWDTTAYPDGSHTVKATAYDSDGNWMESTTKTVTVNNGDVYSKMLGIGESVTYTNNITGKTYTYTLLDMDTGSTPAVLLKWSGASSGMDIIGNKETEICGGFSVYVHAMFATSKHTYFEFTIVP